MHLPAKDQKLVEGAVSFFENHSFFESMMKTMGKPVDYTMKKLPEKAQKIIAQATEMALKKSLVFASRTLSQPEQDLDVAELEKKLAWSKVKHSGLAAFAGGVGGFFGHAGMLVELPITVTLIMRSILDQAKLQVNLSDEELISHAIFVFSMGSREVSSNKSGEVMDSAYLSTRIAFSSLLKNASMYFAASSSQSLMKNLSSGSAPAVMKLVSKVASRFNIVITEKVIAESLPVIGSVGGATINLFFSDYFSKCAYYHFGLLELENRYGADTIHKKYQELMKN